MTCRRSMAAVLSAGLLLLGACAGDDLADEPTPDGETSSSTGGEVSISGQSFPEAELVATMYDLLLTDAGYTVDVKLVDARDVYMQQFPGDIDVVPEYVASLATFLNTTANGADADPIATTDAQETISNMEDLLADKKISLLEPSAATDSNAFFVTQEYAEAEGVSTLSDMEGKTVTLAASVDCEDRPDCGAGLRDVYGIDIEEILPLGFGGDAVYQSVLDDESQLGLTATTDGTLESQGLVMLEDDKGIAQAENLIPAVSTEFLDEHPDVADVLNPLMAALTTENLTELNTRLAVDREKAEDVARDFLVSEGLLEQ